MTNEGLADVAVKSLKTAFEDELHGKIGWLVTLKVLPIIAKGREAYRLATVVSVKQPVEQSKTSEQVKPRQRGEGGLERAFPAPESGSPDARPIQKSQEIEIHRLRKASTIPEEKYYSILGSHGAEHARDLTRSAYPKVVEEITEYAKSM